jgi:hypothetical protein
MEAQAKYRNIKGSERKMRLVVDMVKRKKCRTSSCNPETYSPVSSTFCPQDTIVSYS